ncbi:MAG TPA: hypothetical protein VG758_18405 [Hyphomicrobiaceae bacterium]|jgi:hypothetical protein|nr:hypothetical protein [Hyphomicrobiaceae bacterium]
MSADVSGWAAVLAGLTALAGLVALVERRRRRAPRHAAAAKPPVRLEPAREWDLVLSRAAADLSRAPRVVALQADAAVKLAAAEHAFGRLVGDWQRLCGQPAAPVPEAAPQPVPAPEATEHQPLAA